MGSQFIEIVGCRTPQDVGIKAILSMEEQEHKCIRVTQTENQSQL